MSCHTAVAVPIVLVFVVAPPATEGVRAATTLSCRSTSCRAVWSAIAATADGGGGALVAALPLPASEVSLRDHSSSYLTISVLS